MLLNIRLRFNNLLCHIRLILLEEEDNFFEIVNERILRKTSPTLFKVKKKKNLQATNFQGRLCHKFSSYKEKVLLVILIIPQQIIKWDLKKKVEWQKPVALECEVFQFGREPIRRRS